MWLKILGLITSVDWPNLLQNAKKYWREIIIVVLALSTAWYYKKTQTLDTHLGSATNQIQLQAGEIDKLVLTNNRLLVTIADLKKGGAYVPPESSLTVTLKENKELRKQIDELNKRMQGTTSIEELKRLQAERDKLMEQLYQLSINYDKWGLTCKLGVGILYSKDFYPELDLKWFYWGRYSSKIGMTPYFVDLGLTRHLDDLIPVIKPQNVEAQVIYGWNWTGGSRIGLGVRSNL